ncbi:unnamed protein product [Adineta steineri]|uniref:VWFA domain-containing protein n=1 Tax=Adineta steineri TaxID=433720 RepID=A0A815JYA2_9BILA|nr:unnamed protein product [Adineta steineri]
MVKMHNAEVCVWTNVCIGLALLFFITVDADPTKAFNNPLNGRAVDLFLLVDENNSYMSVMQLGLVKTALQNIANELNPVGSTPSFGVYFYGATSTVNTVVPHPTTTASAFKAKLDLKQYSMMQANPSTLMTALDNVDSACQSGCRPSVPRVTVVFSSVLDLKAQAAIRRLERNRGMTILRHQWYEFVKVYNGSSEHLPPSIHSVESIIPTVPHSVESIASTVSRSDNQSVSEDHSELIFQTKKKNDVLFKRSLKCFKQLLDAIKYLQLPTVNSLIISMVGEIKSIESNIDLADTQSIDDALKAIVSLKKRIIIKFKPESFPPSTHTNFRQIKRAYKKTVQIIVDIIKSLKIYESKTSNLPSSPMPVIVEDELEQENLEDDDYDPNEDA